jgi:hypothetical protein
MDRAKRQEHAGAIDDYTATINMPHVPPDVKAMALFNRALILSAEGNHALARDDLNVVLTLTDTPPEVRTEARRKLVRMERESSRTEEHGHATTDRADGTKPAGLRAKQGEVQSR